MLKAGDKAPAIALFDQHGKKRTLKEFAKRKVLVYFYPKADTPGCTQQSCLLSEIKDDIGRTVIIGISPDEPKKQLKFDTKYSLGFPLLADTEHAVAKAYKVWKKKSMYGREYMGIERSAFLIDGTGK
ncbi:MAG: peroxiredoxin, partial [Acidimicrobiia bacterium]|nr:peroxiredoxin [Acidimicrobiia bacterium]